MEFLKKYERKKILHILNITLSQDEARVGEESTKGEHTLQESRLRTCKSREENKS